MALWLDNTFYGFDKWFFEIFHALANSCGQFFSPFFKFITFFGDKGLAMIFLGVILLLFSKTRKAGLSALLAIIIGSIFTNLILKDAVARVRPYEASELYRSFWEFVGYKKFSSFSFPSGHATVTATTMTALFLCFNKKWSWGCLVFAFLMGLSRIYLTVHYASDVIGGLCIGAISGTIAYFIMSTIYKKLILNKDNAFTKFIKNADLIEFIKEKVKKD